VYINYAALFMSLCLSTYPLRLPRSIRAGVERLSKEDGVSINQFVSIAVAEKVAMMQVQDYFLQRAARADLAACDEVMQHSGGELPRLGDER
jgi:hypothetical protein